MRFKLRQMEVFRAVMLTGSMNSAATAVRVAARRQPADRPCRAEPGPAAVRARQGQAHAPPEAQRLFEEVGPLFEEALRIDELARDLAARLEGALTLCASPSLALNFLPPAIARYLELHPACGSSSTPRCWPTWRTSCWAARPSWRSRCCRSTIPTWWSNRWPRARWSPSPKYPRRAPREPGAAGLAGALQPFPSASWWRRLPAGRERSAAVDILRAEVATRWCGRAPRPIAISSRWARAAGAVARRRCESIPLSLSLARSRFERRSRQVAAFPDQGQHVRGP